MKIPTPDSSIPPHLPLEKGARRWEHTGRATSEGAELLREALEEARWGCSPSRFPSDNHQITTQGGQESMRIAIMGSPGGKSTQAQKVAARALKA